MNHREIGTLKTGPLKMAWFCFGLTKMVKFGSIYGPSELDDRSALGQRGKSEHLIFNNIKSGSREIRPGISVFKKSIVFWKY